MGAGIPWPITARASRYEAFAEGSGPLLIPGPLIRVPAGTEVRLSVRNRLASPLIVHGFDARPASGNDSLIVPVARDPAGSLPGRRARHLLLLGYDHWPEDRRSRWTGQPALRRNHRGPAGTGERRSRPGVHDRGVVSARGHERQPSGDRAGCHGHQRKVLAPHRAVHFRSRRHCSLALAQSLGELPPDASARVLFRGGEPGRRPARHDIPPGSAASRSHRADASRWHDGDELGPGAFWKLALPLPLLVSHLTRRITPRFGIRGESAYRWQQSSPAQASNEWAGAGSTRSSPTGCSRAAAPHGTRSRNPSPGADPCRPIRPSPGLWLRGANGVAPNRPRIRSRSPELPCSSSETSRSESPWLTT